MEQPIQYCCKADGTTYLFNGTVKTCPIYFNILESSPALASTEYVTDAALTESASGTLRSTTLYGTFALSWTAPKNMLETPYWFQLVLETQNDAGVVTYLEKSPVAQCVTKDTTIYTWQPMDGSWNGSPFGRGRCGRAYCRCRHADAGRHGQAPSLRRQIRSRRGRMPERRSDA